MAAAPPSQAPATDHLLSENTVHTGTPYRDNPEADHQHITPSMSHAAESSVDLTKNPEDMQLKPEARKGDLLGVGLVAAGSIVLLLATWITVLANNPKSLGLFAFHPTLQTLSVVFFSFGILTLQPTSNPKTKKAGLARHQLVILALAFPCVVLGGIAIIGNKNLNNYPHFKTWHAAFGILTLVWMFVQICLGAGSVWFGGAAFGGGAKAKGVWKYHRLSGYILFLFFLLTIAIGGGYSQWMVENSSQVTRIFGYAVAPVAILVGLWSRARLSKMKFV